MGGTCIEGTDRAEEEYDMLYLYLLGAVASPAQISRNLANVCLKRCPIVLKFCTEHGGDTAVLCAQCQYGWIIETDIVDERGLTRF